MTTLSAISEHDQRRRDALGERLFDASRAALDVYCVHIGDRLGLYAAPMARVAVALGRPLPELLEAFRSGGGVPWTAYGDDGREAQVDMNRVEFIHRLGSEWLPSIAGAVVMDERTNDRMTIGDPVEQFLYGVSVMVCLPTGMSEEGSAATGTVMRPDTFAGYAREAGFPDQAGFAGARGTGGGVEVLGIEHRFFHFYRLR